MNAQRLSCQILIVGSGPAGLAAARAASHSARSIVLIDDNPRPGGQIWRQGPTPSPAAAERFQVVQHPAVRYLAATRVIAALGPHSLLLEDARQAWQLDFEQLILCCGAQELLLPFPGWTLPGVTGAGGLQALLKNGLSLRGKTLVIAGSGPLLLATAATARQAGARLLRVLEQAPATAVLGFASQLWRWPSKLAQAVQLLTPAYRCNAHVVEALGDRQLQRVRIRQGRHLAELACDYLACGFGLVPNTRLANHLGCRLEQGAIVVDPQQRSSLPQVLAAGECTGIGGSELALIEGEIAGCVASGQSARAATLIDRRRHWQDFAARLQRHFALQPQILQLARPDTLFCRCEDVPYAAVVGAADWSSAKLHSRCGMGACQGRVCASAARRLFDWPEVAPRSPLVPARVATLMLDACPPHAAD
ncbi:NAD(P)/FAD-dependent oxidoreductase [Pseudomonas chlororaphis]|uniref:NAD(P)/FAD-dependent oxidoreductase n=1 Tax=Pseudomonas chlororaphis TaxID=587753 RepID=UPI00209B1704|nr:FAD/NAD(P)-binding oxidoreductase [Pseudomonas chlororaphis]MCO7568912.1 NAD(P)/FAD-dependent oxidoreductase [Pseudomonas chlororaphis]MCO7590836.1 NAD(P)/FAD-dependent oxidoreductase [Pseudomonas chlororaphis]